MVLHKLQDFLIQQDMISRFPRKCSLPLIDHDRDDGDRIPFLGPTWMDDLAVCLESEDPESLLRKTGVAAGRLLELCTEHAMSPNLKKNKTEILLSLQGRHSRRHKRLLFGPQATGTLPVINEYGMHEVALTSNYRHLGGIVHHKADQREEIRRRIGIAHGTVSQFRRLIFRNWLLPLSKRKQLLESLVLSKLLYGAETWITTDDKTEKYFEVAVLRLYRRLLPIPADAHMHDDDILAKIGLPSPRELLRRARLRYVATLLHCGSTTEWGLLEQDRQWTSLVEEDFVWMWEQLKHSSHLQDPRGNWGQWKNLILSHRPYWRRLTRRAFEHAILQRRNRNHIDHFYTKALVFFRELYQYQPHGGEEHAPDHAVRGCLRCRKRCRNRAGEAAHMFRAHGVTASRRALTDTPTCPACLKFYHTMEKVNAHLYYSSSCRRTLQSRNYQCIAEPGTGSELDRHRQQVHDRLLPPLQTEGPRLAPARLREDPGVDNDLHLAILETCIDADTPSQALDGILQLAEERPISWTMWTATLNYFLGNVAPEDFERWEMHFQDIIGLFRTALDPNHWNLQVPFVKELTSLEDKESECRDIAATEWQEHTPIPSSFGRHRVLLHLFSGRRRQGDVQYFLDCMEPPTGYILHVVSLDIVVDAHWGNATEESVREYWLSMAQAGFIVGFLAGPPCETWSVARGKELKGSSGHNRRAPRILRTAESLWGLPSLALQEVMQITIGNALLTVSLLMACAMVKVGGHGVLEHPAEPDAPELATIWRLPIVLALMQAPGVCRHRVAQGLYGAPSRKPTDLLVINMPTLPMAFRDWRLRADPPKGASIGLTEEGAWKTSILKEYPPAMCRALAQAFRSSIDQHCVSQTTEPLASDVSRWTSMHQTVYSKMLGQDFAN